MNEYETKDYRITVTPDASHGHRNHASLLKELKAVGFRVVGDAGSHIEGLIPTDKIEQLAAVPGVSLKLNEEFQIHPIESQAR